MGRLMRIAGSLAIVIAVAAPASGAALARSRWGSVPVCREATRLLRLDPGSGRRRPRRCDNHGRAWNVRGGHHDREITDPAGRCRSRDRDQRRRSGAHDRDRWRSDGTDGVAQRRHDHRRTEHRFIRLGQRHLGRRRLRPTLRLRSRRNGHHFGQRRLGQPGSSGVDRSWLRSRSRSRGRAEAASTTSAR